MNMKKTKNNLGNFLTPTFGDAKFRFCAALLNTSVALASPYVKFSSVFPWLCSSLLELFNTNAIDQTAS